ncbi:S9 family peptidase [Alistipes sp.]|uniref:S9 family peptidase n=1 Tax=Alistipes sp. TaxID=1872444 RepID=UPI003A8C0BEE
MKQSTRRSARQAAGVLLGATLLLTAGRAAAGNEYAEIARLKSLNQSVRGIRSMNDGEHYTTLENNDIRRYAYATAGRGESLLPTPAPNLVITDYTLSPDERMILVASGRHPIYRHSFTTSYTLIRDGRATAILREAEAPRDASFSPDGRRIVYSDRNDLYAYDIETQRTRRLTDDGRWNEVINGTTDWVYEEEFGTTKAYAFSPDGRQLAFLRFDESRVPLMEMMRYDGKLYNRAYSFKYPKAGETNSTVELWVADLETGAKRRLDTGPETDQYIPRIGWTPDGRPWYFRLNRRQNTFEMVVCEPHGAQRTVYEERTQQYVERVDDKTVTFVDRDRFLVRQESHTGYMHLYLYSLRRGLLEQVTKGQWEVTDVVGTDGKRVWFLSTETSPLRRNLYSVRLDGRDKQRLTQGEGYYTVAPSTGMHYFITTFSNASTPNRTEVCDAAGQPLRTLADSRALRDELAASQRPVKEFFTFTTERGDTLNAYRMLPRDFDPAKRYPVLLTQYSGPGSQQVVDRWSMDWEDALVERGYVVVCADGRGTGFRGERFKKQTYGRLGALEVEDQLSLARYMAAREWVDPARIGIYGWSYGGFMALSCALKGCGLFRMAIAVAPVTSWRFYDTIYTEIYNNLPQFNAEGYDNYSPIHFARMLDDRKTRLLIIHGTADDNVHFQNTVEMTRALNRAGKQYDMMVYPDQNHSMLPNATGHVRQKMIDYTLEHL